jgi:hypothetical protein
MLHYKEALMTDHTENPHPEQAGTDATPPADSTIPDSGVAVGYVGEPSTFEPEEDVAEAEGGGTGPRSHEARGMDHEDLSIFRTHWDEFPGHTD